MPPKKPPRPIDVLIQTLPRDIQDEILFYTILPPQVIDITPSHTPWQLQICRAIRHHAQTYYYSRTTFVVPAHQDRSILLPWLRSLTDAQIDAIQVVYLRIDWNLKYTRTYKKGSQVVFARQTLIDYRVWLRERGINTMKKLIKVNLWVRRYKGGDGEGRMEEVWCDEGEVKRYVREEEREEEMVE